MASWRDHNAIQARIDAEAPGRALIVVGDERQARLWAQRLGRQSDGADRSPHIVVERGRKGNLLGTLQVYKKYFLSRGTETPQQQLEQIVMLVGSGTRLSPFTQALGNAKAAFPLPVADAADGRTIGEAAIRASSPLAEQLRAGGFDGLVIRWGDEVVIPGPHLAVPPSRFAGLDAVRFGSPTKPTDFLATEKEWLLFDRETSLLTRELSRQPLGFLEAEIDADRSTPDVYVNLGSFAASHRFLEAACEAFGPFTEDDTTAANWDPYFWIALQCPTHDAWEMTKQREARIGLTGIRDLEGTFPDFFRCVHALRRSLASIHESGARVGILDFGEPYWLDAGNHLALRNVFADIFDPGDEGCTLRAFLGLPDAVAYGESFISNSTITPGVRVSNSIVIGSTIDDPDSDIDQAIVIDTRATRLRMTKGAVAISCVARDLQIDGPHGVAFRLNIDGKVRGHESVTMIITESRSVVMRYDASIGTIDREAYDHAVLDNPMSYRAASGMMGAVDPTWLDSYWRRLSTAGAQGT